MNKNIKWKIINVDSLASLNHDFLFLKWFSNFVLVCIQSVNLIQIMFVNFYAYSICEHFDEILSFTIWRGTQKKTLINSACALKAYILSEKNKTKTRK